MPPRLAPCPVRPLGTHALSRHPLRAVVKDGGSSRGVGASILFRGHAPRPALLPRAGRRGHALGLAVAEQGDGSRVRRATSRARFAGEQVEGVHVQPLGPHQLQRHPAPGYWSSVSGGFLNTASGRYSSVSGGFLNTASGGISSVSAGFYNTASGSWSSVSGGANRSVSGDDDWAAGSLFEDN